MHSFLEWVAAIGAVVVATALLYKYVGLPRKRKAKEQIQNKRNRLKGPALSLSRVVAAEQGVMPFNGPKEDLDHLFSGPVDTVSGETQSPPVTPPKEGRYTWGEESAQGTVHRT